MILEPRVLCQCLWATWRTDGASASPGRCAQFELEPLMRHPAASSPEATSRDSRWRRRCFDEAEILFLDEPTSGADPLARREFSRRITSLAEQGVTVIVTTHFMEEAEYCDRVVIPRSWTGTRPWHPPKSAAMRQLRQDTRRGWRMPSSLSSRLAEGRTAYRPTEQRVAAGPHLRFGESLRLDGQGVAGLDTGQKGGASNSPRSQQHCRRMVLPVVLILLLAMA